MIKKKLEIIFENEKIRLKQMESIFSKLPKGKLYTRTVRGKKYFSVYLNGKEKGITHDQELVEQFKTKETLETNIDSTANTCSLISSVIDSLPNYSCNDPISICWSKEKYDSNPYKAEHLLFKTLKGHLEIGAFHCRHTLYVKYTLSIRVFSRFRRSYNISRFHDFKTK